MRWAKNDNLSLLLLKAEQCYPSLNPTLRGNVVAAAFAAWEEDRVSATVRAREMELNHQTFMNDFDEWMHTNSQVTPPEGFQDGDLASLRELAEALDQ